MKRIVGMLALIVGICVIALISYVAGTTSSSNHESEQGRAPIGDDRKAPICRLSTQDLSPWDIATGKGMIKDCTVVNKSITRAEWQSCMDHSYQLTVDSLRRLINTPDGKPYTDVLNATLEDGIQIYEANKHSYLEGADKNQMNGAMPKEQSLMVMVATMGIGNALAAIATPPDPRESIPFEEGGRDRAERAVRDYQKDMDDLAKLADIEQFNSRCNDSIDALRAESTKGYEQIAQANSLYPSSIDAREYYLRVNYGTMFISDAGMRVAYCKSASLPPRPAARESEGHYTPPREPAETSPPSAGPRRIGDGVSAPILIYSVEPELSEEARKNKIEGNVLVGFWVDTDGKPSHIRVLRGIGYGLDENAVEAVRQYKFKPAMENGKPVLVELNAEVNYQIF